MSIQLAIGTNIAFFIIGYLVGSLNFSLIITKIFMKKNDIRTQGSKNAGSTNTLRVYGKKIGLLVFVLDVSKTFWLGIIVALLRTYIISFWFLIPSLAMLTTVIGHIFPIFFKFKGGKGAACNLGIIAATNIIVAMIGFVIFFAFIFITKYVSLGSIITPFILASLLAIPFFYNYFPLNWITSTNFEFVYIPMIVLFISAIIVTLAHHENIKKLFNHTENKIFKSKKNKLNSTKI